MTDLEADLLDLVETLYAALSTAHTELAILANPSAGEPWPVPDDLQGALDQRLALLATMRRAPEEMRGQLRAVYREEAGRSENTSPYVMPAVPVLPEVCGELAAAMETMRRRGLLVPAVQSARVAVEGIPAW